MLRDERQGGVRKRLLGGETSCDADLWNMALFGEIVELKNEMFSSLVAVFVHY